MAAILRHEIASVQSPNSRIRGNLLKLKSKIPTLGPSWNKRYFCVEHRLGASGRELALSYYTSESKSGDAINAKAWLFLREIEKISRVTKAYINDCTTLTESQKRKARKHYKFMFEVTSPRRTFWLRAEREAEIQLWVAGLQLLCALPPTEMWPHTLGPEPLAPPYMKKARLKPLADGDDDEPVARRAITPRVRALPTPVDLLGDKSFFRDEPEDARTKQKRIEDAIRGGPSPAIPRRSPVASRDSVDGAGVRAKGFGGGGGGSGSTGGSRRTLGSSYFSTSIRKGREDSMDSAHRSRQDSHGSFYSDIHGRTDSFDSRFSGHDVRGDGRRDDRRGDHRDDRRYDRRDDRRDAPRGSYDDRGRDEATGAYDERDRLGARRDDRRDAPRGSYDGRGRDEAAGAYDERDRRDGTPLKPSGGPASPRPTPRSLRPRGSPIQVHGGSSGGPMPMAPLGGAKPVMTAMKPMGGSAPRGDAIGDLLGDDDDDDDDDDDVDALVREVTHGTAVRPDKRPVSAHVDDDWDKPDTPKSKPKPKPLTGVAVDKDFATANWDTDSPKTSRAPTSPAAAATKPSRKPLTAGVTTDKDFATADWDVDSPRTRPKDPKPTKRMAPLSALAPPPATAGDDDDTGSDWD